MTVQYAPGYAARHSAQRSLLAVLAYIAFLLLIFVGLDAFSPPAAVSRFGGPSRGDAMRQVSFLAVAGLIVFAAYKQLGLSMLRAIPVSMALLLGWCLASALWAQLSNDQNRQRLRRRFVDLHHDLMRNTVSQSAHAVMELLSQHCKL